MFKKRKAVRSNIRTASSSVDEKDQAETSQTADAGEDVNWSALDGFRELKRAKKRIPNGINVLDLMKECKKEEKTAENVGKGGGLTDAKTLASELNLENTFSLETNRRDEDSELMKYVEEELAKRRAKSNAEAAEDSINVPASKSSLSDDLLLRVIPEHLLKIGSEEEKVKNEEMLSSQMLSGIPEIDLGIEERIRNIEKTEAARTKLLEDKIRQEKERTHDRDISLAPKNLSSCFTRGGVVISQGLINHRFSVNSVPNQNKDLMDIRKDGRGGFKQANHKFVPRQNYEIEPVVVLGAEPQKVRLLKPIDRDKRVPGKDKPSDDFVFEKFRKHLRRH